MRFKSNGKTTNQINYILIEGAFVMGPTVLSLTLTGGFMRAEKTMNLFKAELVSIVAIRDRLVNQALTNVNLKFRI